MKQYNIIYADPPWSYRVWSDKGTGRSAEKHYPTMTLSQIAKLPVEKIAAKNAILFLWVTFPSLQEAFSIISAWGFTYKTVAFVWVKQNKKTPTLFWGMGYWTRSNVELCLLATKGQPKRISANVHQVILAPVMEHSRKPAEVRDRIIALVGDLPRVELFARQVTPGWDVWGNEVPCSAEMPGYSQ